MTISLAPELLEALKRAPGRSRSEKVERLLREALARRAHGRWVSELQAFYARGRPADEHREDLDWQTLAAQAFARDD